jgi:glycosyltransferase involved in cell wall biosynthesis
MNSGSQERPLVTFFVCAYKQEQFIREAVAGAFAQTYSPLEIILSDDCSPDRTFEIMQEMAAAYRGPHKIVLNRTSSNVGLCGHLNWICDLANGEWLIAGAGDDVSQPERTAAIVATVRENPKAAYVLSEAFRFSGSWPPNRDRLQLSSELIGATEAFRLATFRRFGHLQTNTYNEDWAFYFRGQLDGVVLFLRRPLLFYRVIENGLTGSYNKRTLSSVLDVHYRNLVQFRFDLETISPDRNGEFGDMHKEIQKRLDILQVFNDVSTGQVNRIIAAFNILRKAGCPLAKRVAMAVLVSTPELYRFYERLRHSRFNRCSPTNHSIGYLNPKSLLVSPADV